MCLTDFPSVIVPSPVVFFVAGCSFRRENVQAACGELNKLTPPVPQPITLYPEKNNPFDPLALKIYLCGHHIGYVPRTHNAILHENKSKGFRTNAILLGYYPTSRIHEMFQVQCTFTPIPTNS